MGYKVKSRTLGEANMPWAALQYPVIASIKYDGRSTIVHKKGNEITYETSGGKTFKLVDNFPFDQLPDGHFFAEMMGENIPGLLGDRIYSGIQTSCVSNTKKGLLNNHKPTWKIFSFLNDDDYKRNKSSLKYHTIIDRIDKWEETLSASFCPVYKLCNNEADLRYFYQFTIVAGWEGLMVSSKDQAWDNSTSRLKTLVKLKGRHTIKGTCIGTNNGEGKYKYMRGALVVKLESGVIFTVGSGLSDSDRSKDHTYFLGKIIEVEYEQLSADGIPLQPTFICIREAL